MIYNNMFLSGDNLNMICNLSIYERKYYDRYVTSKLENILFINEDNGKLIDSITLFNIKKCRLSIDIFKFSFLIGNRFTIK